MRVMRSLVILAVVGAAAVWFLSRPDLLSASAVAGLTPDPTHGEQVFWAAGCASCHTAAEATGAAELVLSGGQRFQTEFGTFIAPNISSDQAEGIGAWSVLDLANAVTRGVSPEGAHYYPALPYAAYAKMSLQDVADLHAFMQTLPADATPSQPHALTFPFSRRETVGLWKLLFLRDGWIVSENLTPTADRGRYIVEAMAHCGECHTPRNALGGLDTHRWLAGAPHPSGQGRIPNITPARLNWSEGEIVEYLTSGFTPDFDTVGGDMVHVVRNMARLPEGDRVAVAAYLKRVAPVE